MKLSLFLSLAREGAGSYAGRTKTEIPEEKVLHLLTISPANGYIFKVSLCKRKAPSLPKSKE